MEFAGKEEWFGMSGKVTGFGSGSEKVGSGGE
jgi:hypothetical protein